MTRTPDQAPQQAEPQASPHAEPQAVPAASPQAEPQAEPQAVPPAGPHGARPAEQLRADARQNRARLIIAATEAFAEKGADAPLEDVARRAGVGIGTLYRHFPSRLDLQAAVFRSQVVTICGQGDTLLESDEPGQAFATWCQALAAYLVTKRGLSKALIEAVGAESELMKSCWMAMRDTTERLLAAGQQAGVIRSDVDSMDVMRLVHGVAVSTERDPGRAGLLLSVTLDGLRAKPA
jgi:AcrR family transcriptional regulator